MHEAIYISFALFDIYKKKLGIPKSRDMWHYLCNIRNDGYAIDKKCSKIFETMMIEKYSLTYNEN